MISNSQKKALKDVANHIKALLDKGMELELIESHIIQEISCLNDNISIISGFNRTGRISKNTVKFSETSPFLSVINVMDGQVNYDRGSQLFGFSVSLMDLKDSDQFSVVYDGLKGFNDTEAGALASETNDKSIVGKKRVIAMGMIFTLQQTSLELMRGCSLRSLGSTTITISEVLIGNIDLFVTKTKIWNVWWAIQFVRRSRLMIDDIAIGQSFASCLNSYLSDPEKSVYIAAYKSEKVRREMGGIVEDLRLIIK